ncbi:MAG: complex I NDUFA9 subunit family protein [Verrucomicrobiae bacterium]|nr:complex I NDUFA9 subunit family protein [Verrucomicrobiae bacterium]
MTVAVTGGTGFVGREIVGRLIGEGHAVRVVSRGVRRPVPGADWCRGSVLEPESLLPAFRGCEAVIHLAGIISEIGEQTFARVHAEGTRHVIAACEATGVPRLVHMSALGTRPEARSRYHQSKWLGEESVRSSRLLWTMFRPSLIYGPGDGFVTLFARMARWSPVIPVLGPGTQHFQPVTVAEVARSFAGALRHAGSAGSTLDLCGPERLTLNELLRAIASAVGRPGIQIHLPWRLAFVQARILEAVFPVVFRSAPPLNRDQVRMLQEDNIGDPASAWRLFGIEPVRFSDGIRAFLTPGS